MANEQNLRPSEYKFTKADYEKSQVSRQENAKRKRDIRLALEMLLEREYALEDGTVLTGAEAIALKQFEKALNDGDTKAFEVVRDTAGQKPVEKHEQSVSIDSPKLDSVFNQIGGEGLKE